MSHSKSSVAFRCTACIPNPLLSNRLHWVQLHTHLQLCRHKVVNKVTCGSFGGVNQMMLLYCLAFHPCFHNVVWSSYVFLWFWRLRELLGGAWGRLRDPLGAIWASSGHLGGATGHGKRTDDKTWCAMVMGFRELMILRWCYKVF